MALLCIPVSELVSVLFLQSLYIIFIYCSRDTVVPCIIGFLYSTHTHKACCMNARGSDVSTCVFVSFPD